LTALAVTALCGGLLFFQTAPVQPERETLAAIQIHGNTVTSDEEIRAMMGVAVGEPFESDTAATVATRLRQTKRFESVQVLKRFASISDLSQVTLVVIVDEGPVRIETTGDPDHPTRVVRSGRTHLLFLPVLNFEDGYGFTYGARLAWPEPLGKQSRVAFPLTWGGEKRAAAELDKTLEGRALTRVTAGGGISERENPHYELDDTRVRVWARGEREFSRSLRAGATLGWQQVSFGPVTGEANRFADGGADLVFDTRVDPILPRNAVYARAAYERIVGTNRTEVEARGYAGLIGQLVLEVRAQAMTANRPLQPYLKPLLGGMSNLRGFAAGTAAGDSLAAGSVELIAPLTSPLGIGKIGVSAFSDTGTVWDYGQQIGDQPWLRGFGGSVWFSAAFIRINVAVAHGIGASTRVHFGANATF
jgi:hypothetical protein